MNSTNMRRPSSLLALTLLCMVLCTGCADLTPRQKFWVGVGTAIAVGGAIAIYESEHHDKKADQSASANCVYRPTSSICAVM